MRDFQRRVDVAGAQVICSEVISEVEKLDNSELSDEAYERLIRQVINKLVRILFAAGGNKLPFTFRVYDQAGRQINAA
ncbi:MAG: hypothetical protein ACU837_14145 [Gammaproteobacteria bacterium]